MYKLLLSWQHIYEVGGITGIAKIRRGIEEFLQYFTTATVIHITHL